MSCFGFFVLFWPGFGCFGLFFGLYYLMSYLVVLLLFVVVVLSPFHWFIVYCDVSRGFVLLLLCPLLAFRLSLVLSLCVLSHLVLLFFNFDCVVLFLLCCFAFLFYFCFVFIALFYSVVLCFCFMFIVLFYFYCVFVLSVFFYILLCCFIFVLVLLCCFVCCFILFCCFILIWSFRRFRVVFSVGFRSRFWGRCEALGGRTV